MLLKFQKKKFNKKDVVLEWKLLQITKLNFDEILTTNEVSDIVMTFFCTFLLERQKINPDFFCRKNKNRLYPMCAEVMKYNEYHKTIEYYFTPGFVNYNYKHKKYRLYNEFERLGVILRYDERWVLGIAVISQRQFYLVDFLEQDLSRTPQVEMVNIFKYFLKQEFNIEYTHKILNMTQTVDKYIDCGFLIMSFLHKVMNTK